MPLGIVYGQITDSDGSGVDNAVCILDTIREMGTAGRRAGGLPIEPVEPVGEPRPPYGVASVTDSAGVYRLLYNWNGYHADELLSTCRFRVMVFQNDRQFRFLGADATINATIGLDLRTLVLGELLPLDAFTNDEVALMSFLDEISDTLEAFKRTSGVIRGLIHGPQENYMIATRLDIRTSR